MLRPILDSPCRSLDWKKRLRASLCFNPKLENPQSKIPGISISDF